MNPHDIDKAGFSSLLELAESKFYAWHLRELRPERDRRISELKKQNVTSGGRAVSALRIYRELMEREVRERIGFYAAIARESGNAEMLSQSRLDEYRERIMTSVRAGCGTLRGDIVRDVHTAGDLPESALPNEHRYVQLRAEILDIVNAELRVLENEGNLAGEATSNGGPSPHAGHKKRGRPQTIPDEKKAAAAKRKAAGGTNKQAAALLYDQKYPSTQQVKNVPAILKHYRRKSEPPGSLVHSRKAPPKPHKTAG